MDGSDLMGLMAQYTKALTERRAVAQKEDGQFGD